MAKRSKKAVKKAAKKSAARLKLETIVPASHEAKTALKKSRPDGEGVQSTHKRRSDWFRERAAWPVREAPVDDLVRARRQAKRLLPRYPPAKKPWQLAGPVNIGGRMTAVAVHPQDPDKLWAGAAGGGVWRSDDGGQTWEALWHHQDSLNIGALAMDPQNPDLIYCGTGEANLSADSYPGVGLYRSRNGGRSWAVMTRSSRAGIPARIGVIAVDPFDSRRLLLGGVGHRFPSEPKTGGMGGIFESHDGGATWERLVFVSPHEHRCHAIVFDPSRQGRIWAAVAEQGMRNGIWRTTNGGETWQHLTVGLPSPELFERTSLAAAPSDPNVLYALAANHSQGVLGVFRSSDGGDSWTAIHKTHFKDERQMSYNNAIAVHPEDPGFVICGGVDLHRTEDGGQTWTKITRWDLPAGHAKYAHADHHALFIPPADPNRVYSLNDGGMDVSFDGGTSWENRSNGLAVTMYYDLDVAPTNSAFFGGGSQDNGTPITTTGAPDDHRDVTGGDGGWLVFDPTDHMRVYASIYNMNIFRFTRTAGWVDVSPPEAQNIKNRLWMVFIEMDPVRTKRVFTGSWRVWRTKNDGASWQPVSEFFAGRITAIEVCRADPDRVYVGTANGEIYRSLDGGDTWSGDISGTELPTFQINRIASAPDDADKIMAVIGNFGASHVFRSFDGGLSWQDCHGDLPRIPFNSIAIPRGHPGEIYLASDSGVYASTDFGVTWADASGDLPNASIVDVVYHDASGTLWAATYGRSIWRLKIREPEGA